MRGSKALGSPVASVGVAALGASRAESVRQAVNPHVAPCEEASAGDPLDQKKQDSQERRRVIDDDLQSICYVKKA